MLRGGYFDHRDADDLSGHGCVGPRVKRNKKLNDLPIQKHDQDCRVTVQRQAFSRDSPEEKPRAETLLSPKSQPDQTSVSDACTRPKSVIRKSGMTERLARNSV